MTRNLRLSHSQVAMCLRCPKQWWYRYVKGYKIPPGGYMITGTAFHGVVEADLTRRMTKGGRVSQEEAADIYADVFKKEIGKDEIDWGEDEPGELKDDGIVLAKSYVKNVTPGILPVMVEHKDQFEIIPGVDMMVVIDAVDARHKALDMKVTGKKWADGAAEQEIQHYPYVWYLARLEGIEKPWEADIAFEYHVNLRHKARKLREHPEKWDPEEDALLQIQSPANVLTEAGFKLYREQVDGVAKQIRAGIFPPRGREAKNFWCSPDMCGFWSFCKGSIQKTFVAPDTSQFITTELVPFGDAK